jgi:hypothetical protein
MFASTQPDLGQRFHFEWHWLEIGAGVGAIAIRLISRPAAATPPIFTSFQISFDGIFAGDNGFTHVFILLVIPD